MRIIERINPVYIYYAIMLGFMVLSTSESEPGFSIRYGFLFAFFTPLVFKHLELLPACLICFMTVGLYGFTYSFFPYQMALYPIICLIAALFGKHIFNHTYSVFDFIIIYLLLHLFLINVLDSGKPQDVFYSILTVVLFSVIIGNKTQNNSYYLMNSFAIISLTLSCVYFVNYQRFLTSYNMLDGMERSGWTDPNYLSCIIGMGVVTSVLLIFVRKKSSLLMKIFWLGIAGLSFSAQLLMASRSGILAVVVAIGIILLASNIKKRYKILFVAICLVFVIVLYDKGFFDLLEYRIENDSGGGSGRDIIWQIKFDTFINHANILQLLFGIGSESALKMTGQYIGFHNDYLSSFCSYGLIGLFLLCYLLCYPIKISIKSQRPVVLAMMLYLAICSLTLEPLTSGRLTYIAFYYLIFLYAKSTRQILYS